MPENSMNSTEKQILAAAEEEFLSKGFAGARTVAIAQKAGVTHAMLHYYFRTKERLFESVLEEKVQLLASSVLSTLYLNAKDLSFTDRIEAFIRGHLRFVMNNEHLPLFVINELVSNPKRIEMLKNKLENMAENFIYVFQSQMNKAVARGEICRINLQTLLMDIVSLNLFAVIAKPLFISITNMSDEEYFSWRCQEIITVIKKRIAK